MILIDINTILKNAIYEGNIETLEGILISSDSRFSLLQDYAKNEDLDLLIKILPKFRSKGVIQDIENYCDLIKERSSLEKEDALTFKPFVKKYVHHENKIKNSHKYSNEDTFSKTRIKL